MHDVIKTEGTSYRLDSVTYVWGLANMGGGCLRLERTKKFFRYKSIGITYIVSEGDTISDIIFYPPFIGKTEKGVVIGKTTVVGLNISDIDEDIKHCHPDRLGLDHHNHFSENAKQYVYDKGIYYGFRNKRRKITEVRIGD